MELYILWGDVLHPETLKYSNYSYNNGQLATNSVLCLHVDKSGRLWAGTEGGGLYLYDYKENVFTEKNQEYQLSADMIGSIEEDRQGCLWMGTNMGLVQLFVPMDENLATVRVYTTADGLQDNFSYHSLLAVGRASYSLEEIRVITVSFLHLWRKTMKPCLI